MEITMFLLLFNKGNLLLGFVPETIGLLLFGVALIIVTVGLRWFLNEKTEEENSIETLETQARESIK